MNSFDNKLINFFDWLLLLFNGNTDQEIAFTAVSLFKFCENITRSGCLEAFVIGKIPQYYYDLRDKMTETMKSLNLKSGFEGIFTALWHGKLPCYDTYETRPSTKISLNLRSYEFVKK
jgi:hypothetical protein